MQRLTKYRIFTDYPTAKNAAPNRTGDSYNHAKSEPPVDVVNPIVPDQSTILGDIRHCSHDGNQGREKDAEISDALVNAAWERESQPRADHDGDNKADQCR